MLIPESNNVNIQQSFKKYHNIFKPATFLQLLCYPQSMVKSTILLDLLGAFDEYELSYALHYMP